jgi:flagellar hook-basal body complex protein FliE
MAIDAIAAKVLTPGALEGRALTGGTGASTAPGFGDSLRRLVDDVTATNAAANASVSGMLQGTTDVHDAMIALQRADHTLQFSVQVRNKLVNAYQEIMRMPV